MQRPYSVITASTGRSHAASLQRPRHFYGTQRASSVVTALIAFKADFTYFYFLFLYQTYFANRITYFDYLKQFVRVMNIYQNV